MVSKRGPYDCGDTYGREAGEHGPENQVVECTRGDNSQARTAGQGLGFAGRKRDVRRGQYNGESNADSAERHGLPVEA